MDKLEPTKRARAARVKTEYVAMRIVETKDGSRLALLSPTYPKRAPMLRWVGRGACSNVFELRFQNGELNEAIEISVVPVEA